MLDSIITSKTRIKLLFKFFLNSNTKSYLRNLEQEFGESSNAIRVELNRLENADLLHSEFLGNRKYFSANTNHPLFKDINNIIKNFVGIDMLIEKVINQIGNLETAYITGDLAKGIDSQIIDLVMVGQNFDTSYIEQLVSKAENVIERKIRYLILTKAQMSDYFKNKPVLLIWEQDKN
jgi:predicted transcriptional regulator